MNINELELINLLANIEVVFIEKSFLLSKDLGLLAFANSKTSFVEGYLRKTYGDIIPALSTEYRFFLVGILKNIKDEYKDILIQEAIIPTLGNVETKDILDIINKK